MMQLGTQLRAIVLVLLIWTGWSVQAQEKQDWRSVTQEDLKITAEATGNKDADAMILLREARFDAKGDLKTEVYVRTKIFTDAGKKRADVELPYFPRLMRIDDIRGRTIKPDGTILALEQRQALFDKLVLSVGRGQIRAKTFTLPGVEPGCIIEYRYREVFKRKLNRLPLDIQGELFTKEIDYSYRLPPAPLFGEWKIHWFNNRGQIAIQPKFEKDWVRIQVRDVPPFIKEAYMPPEKAVKVWGLAHMSMNLALLSSSLPSRRPLMSNLDAYWADFARIMYAAIEEQLKKKNKEVKQTVARLISPGNSEDVKIRKIYDFVQREIKNLSYVHDESADAQPPKENKHLGDVLTHRYGDADDITLLFIALLREASVDARVGLLVSGDEDVFRPTFHNGFVQFNDRVAVVRTSSGWRFFDPGSLYCPVGMVSWEKSATPILVLGEIDPQFVQGPQLSSGTSVIHREASLTLDANGTAGGEVKVTWSGYPGISLKREYDSLSAEERTERFKKFMEERVPGVSVSNVSLENVTDVELPFIARCRVEVSGYAAKTGRRLFIQPSFFNRSKSSEFPESTRKHDIDFPYCWKEVDKIVMALPDGYEPEPLPQNQTIRAGDSLIVNSTYSREGNHLVFERELISEALFVETKFYPSLKQLYDAVHEIDSRTIAMKEK